LVKKFEACKATNVTIDKCEEANGEFVIVCTRDVPSNPPGFAKKFLKSTNTITETDTWNVSDKTGTFIIEIKGAPIKVNGTLAITSDGDGCVNTIETNIKCSIPLVGGKIAGFVEDDTKGSLEDDYNFTKGHIG
ncbi:MAG: hypothetical protein B6I31_05120, partial [Desulfobacteraceae bacterium 4572_19]